MLFQGIMFAITPIVAQLYGSRDFTKIGQKMRQIFWIAIIIAFSIFFIFLFLSKILLFFPLDKNILSISTEYLRAVSVGMFFYVMFRYLSSYSEGMTLTLPVFFVVLLRNSGADIYPIKDLLRSCLEAIASVQFLSF